MKSRLNSALCLILFFSTSQLFAIDLYDGFKNPPNTARPFARWAWDEKSPTKKEITRQFDTFQKAGFGGVEISPGLLTDEVAKMIKYAAEAAQKHRMLVDLTIGPDLSAQNLPADQRIQIVTTGKQILKGPVSFRGHIRELIKQADETQNIFYDPNSRAIFLRLVPLDPNLFTQGQELIKTVPLDGTVAFDINDSNDYALYICVWHQNYVKQKTVHDSLIDPFNKQAVDKYLNNFSAKLTREFGGKPGNFLHAVACEGLDLHSSNWTSDLTVQFYNRRGYNPIPYLPMIFDANITPEKSRFYDTIRRTRYDYCLTLAQLYHERFVETFRDWCRDNGVLSRIEPPAYPAMFDFFADFNVPDVPQSENTPAVSKIASSAAFFANKSITSCRISVPPDEFFQSTDISFLSGVNYIIFDFNDASLKKSSSFKNISDRCARLSYLFQNSKPQARIAILFPRNDLWSDCGFSLSQVADYYWYLFPLWQALNQNGYTVDYINEEIFDMATYDNGLLHVGPRTYDAVIVPDCFSVEFLTAKILRFYAQAGGKIVFIGRPPETCPGFHDLIVRSVPVSITMEYLSENDPNRVVFLKAPEKDKDNLFILTAQLMKTLKLAPDVNITPASPDVSFIHYLANGRDIFFFTNTNSSKPVSFTARFPTNDKTPAIWDPETGNRSIFPYGDKKDTLNITLQPLKSLLLVFESNTPESAKK